MPLSTLDSWASLSFTMAGPTSDLRLHQFRQRRDDSGLRDGERDSQRASLRQRRQLSLHLQARQFPPRPPALFDRRRGAAHGDSCWPAQPASKVVTYGAKNKVVNFSVDGSPWRRGGPWSRPCQLQPVPRGAFAPRRPAQSDRVLRDVPQSVEHRRTSAPRRAQSPPTGRCRRRASTSTCWCTASTTGENLLADNRPYVVVGFGGSHNDFSEVRYPAMSPTGAPGRPAQLRDVPCQRQRAEPAGWKESGDRSARADQSDSSRSPRPARAAMCDLPTASHVLSNSNSPRRELRGLPQQRRTPSRSVQCMRSTSVLNKAKNPCLRARSES